MTRTTCDVCRMPITHIACQSVTCINSLLPPLFFLGCWEPKLITWSPPSFRGFLLWPFEEWIQGCRQRVANLCARIKQHSYTGPFTHECCFEVVYVHVDRFRNELLRTLVTLYVLHNVLQSHCARGLRSSVMFFFLSFSFILLSFY